MISRRALLLSRILTCTSYIVVFAPAAEARRGLYVDTSGRRRRTASPARSFIERLSRESSALQGPAACPAGPRNEHRAIDHGYATTSYRSRSRHRRCCGLRRTASRERRLTRNRHLRFPRRADSRSDRAVHPAQEIAPARGRPRVLHVHSGERETGGRQCELAKAKAARPGKNRSADWVLRPQLGA
jgi:hypothetical protein